MEDNLLIEDYNTVETIIEESESGEKKVKFRGILSESDTFNGNHRIYKYQILKDAFNELKKSMDEGKDILGELEHPSTAKINMDRLAVKFTKLDWKGTPDGKGQIIGESIPLDTPCGNLVKGLSKDVKICFSTRSSGKLKPYTGPLAEGKTGYFEVEPGLKIIAIDVVSTPSCQKAIMDTVYEEKMVNEEVHNPTFKTVFDSLL